MDELHELMKVVLANTFTYYMKAHGYHWNVIGPDFTQLHDLFGDIYEDAHGAIDDIAEQLRQIESFAPGTLARMIELSKVTEDEAIPAAPKMVTNLIAANDVVYDSLKEAYDKAEEVEECGLANFLQDRMMSHKKFRWKLRATAGQKP